MLTRKTHRKSLLRLASVGSMLILGLLCVAGCKSVDEQKSLDFSLPGVEMNEGAVALQVAVVQVDDDQQEILDKFWSRLDTMKLGLSQRQIADSNGLRYAVMSPQCPAVLDQLLERRELDTSKLTDIQKQMAAHGLLESPSPLLHHQRIENDTGEEFEIPVSDYYHQKNWAIVGKHGPAETGSGEMVKAFIQMSTFPQGNGSVRLVVEPEIHHGRPQQRYDVSQRTFLFSESQIESRVEPLKFVIDLQPGEALIIAPTPQTISGIDQNGDNLTSKSLRQTIGDLFFVDSPIVDDQASPSQQSQQSQLIKSAFEELDKQFGESPENQSEEKNTAITETTEVKPLCRFLMVRLIHSHASDLFDRASSAERLTTINLQ
jgi:hypothetical protein